MPKRMPVTKAALERALAEIHPDRDTALELVRMGIYRIGKHRRLRNGKCEAHARSTGRPCQAPAMENGRCKLHGGLSTGARTPEGRQRQRAAWLKYWERWRLDNVRVPGSVRARAAGAQGIEKPTNLSSH